ncbi:NUDIX hydrolase [Actinomadura sp. NPDC023710]|uniref:NUDIX hydrolase n=1 Tax=Actinomadura sp. NPDC023710 TaxID=3158219 RepID=UPI0033E51C5C
MTDDPSTTFTHALAAAGALFFNEHDHTMLVDPSYKDYRDIPGGYVEHGETPRQAAEREIAEELGIRPKIGRLLVADWAPNKTEGDKILFLFDGGSLTADQLNAIRLEPSELVGWHFHDITQIHDLTIPRLARRLLHAHAARRDGGTRYLEHGERI